MMRLKFTSIIYGKADRCKAFYGLSKGQTAVGTNQLRELFRNV